LEPCPFFRNEIGGEGEREVGLTRCCQGNGIHRPSLSYGVSVLEPLPGETLWKHTCPLQKRPLPIESVDEGAHYYRRYFVGERRRCAATYAMPFVALHKGFSLVTQMMSEIFSVLSRCVHCDFIFF
jgi:hypothetical protein